MVNQTDNAGSLENRRKWKWFPGILTPEQIREVVASGGRAPDEIYVNELYEVWLTRIPAQDDVSWPAMIRLSLKSRDRSARHDWRHLQRIKNELVGPDHDAVELYPAESRLVDTANQYYLYVLAVPGMRFPFGQTSREVIGKSTGGAKQRKFETIDKESMDAGG